jgi:hypothetical protein
MTMLLGNKNAVIYGGEGPSAERSPGSSLARGRVFLAGRTREKLEAEAGAITGTFVNVTSGTSPS